MKENMQMGLNELQCDSGLIEEFSDVGVPWCYACLQVQNHLVCFVISRLRDMPCHQ